MKKLTYGQRKNVKSQLKAYKDKFGRLPSYWITAVKNYILEVRVGISD